MIETIQAFANYAESHESLLAANLQRVCGTSRSFVNPTETQTLLGHIKLIIGEPEIIAIWGSSGVGKSTMLKAISGADPEQQFQGEVHLRGNLVRSTGSKEPTPGIVYMGQEPIFSSQTLTVEHLLRAACTTEDARIKVQNILEALQLPKEVLKASPQNLSGGQRQRIQIARAVLREPKVLILDEPSNALDPRAKRALAQIIRNIKKQVAGALLVSTHDIELTKHIADNVLVLGNNWLQEDGSPGWNNIFVDTDYQAIEEKGLSPLRLVASPSDPEQTPLSWQEVGSVMTSKYSILPGSLEPKAA